MKWDTPFSGASFPAVEVIPSANVAGAVDIIVRPKGLETYPAYLVSFECVPAYRNHYEGMIFKSWRSVNNSCCFIVSGSPWIEEFRESKEYIEASYARPFDELKHFAIVGGDNVIEVISFEAKISEVDKKRLFREIWI
jgi:hypothetical protein